MTLVLDFPCVANLRSKARHVVIQIPCVINLENHIAKTSRTRIVALALEWADAKSVTKEKSLVE